MNFKKWVKSIQTAGYNGTRTVIEIVSETKMILYNVLSNCTEVRFASFLSGGFITAIVVNPPERKLAKRTSVNCTDKRSAKHRYFMNFMNFIKDNLYFKLI